MWRADLLHDLGLLDDEGAEDALADAVGAPGATIRTVNGPLVARQAGVLNRAKRGHLQNQCRCTRVTTEFTPERASSKSKDKFKIENQGNIKSDET